jgi:antitoxin HicB
MSLTYPINLEPDDNGTLLVTCPALPEVTTFGGDEAEAIKHARDAIEEAIAARMADGRNVPAPKGKRRVLVTLPMQTSLKVELYRLLTRENITRAELMRRLNWKCEAVDRLFRLNHATRLEQFDAAFRAHGHRVEISIRGTPTGVGRAWDIVIAAHAEALGATLVRSDVAIKNLKIHSSNIIGW